MSGGRQASGRQRGFVMIFALVMLVLMTLLAVSAFHLGATQTLIVANAQHRSEGIDAAQAAIDSVLNSQQWSTLATTGSVTPDMTIPASNCGDGSTSTYCLDVNGDNTMDIKVSLATPICVWAAAPRNLDMTKDSDQGCVEQQNQLSFGVENPNGPITTTLCADSDWELQATAQDVATNTTVTVVQGFSLRMDSSLSLPRCQVQL